jgi:6-phosphogluconate dehydrogenase (decarboxylating)
VKSYVQDSGKGRWMLMDALDKNYQSLPCSPPYSHDSVSGKMNPFSEKMLAAFGYSFGGHSVKHDCSLGK